MSAIQYEPGDVVETRYGAGVVVEKKGGTQVEFEDGSGASMHEITALVAMSKANERQVGGEHYQKLDPQPWDVIHAWGLGFLEGCILKRIGRWRHKNGVEDLRKARHELDKLIEQAEAEQRDQVAM